MADTASASSNTKTHIKHNTFIDFSFRPESNGANTVRLTRLNRLFDRWVSLEPTTVGIATEHVYRILLQTDTCSSHTLEKYQKVLVDRHPQNQGDNHILSRAAFLSMFQHERSAVIHAMIGLVDKYKKTKDKRAQKTHSSTSCVLKNESEKPCLQRIHPSLSTDEDLVGTVIKTNEKKNAEYQVLGIDGMRPRAYTEQKPASRKEAIGKRDFSYSARGAITNVDAEKSSKHGQRHKKQSKYDILDANSSGTSTTQAHEDSSLSSMSMNYVNKPQHSYDALNRRDPNKFVVAKGRQKEKRGKQDSPRSQSKLLLYSSSKNYESSPYLSQEDPIDEDYSCFFLDGIIQFFNDLLYSDKRDQARKY